MLKKLKFIIMIVIRIITTSLHFFTKEENDKISTDGLGQKGH